MEHEALTGMVSDKAVVLEEIKKKQNLKFYLSSKATI